MAKVHSQRIKQGARNLRHKGWSMGEISLRMRIPKNTIAGWVKEIRLTKRQKVRIRAKIIASSVIGRPLAVKANRNKIEQWKKDIRNSVKHFKNIPLKNPELEKLACSLLYLCEGARYPASRFLYFGNSNPKLIASFVNLLRKAYQIDENKLRFDIGYRYDQDFKKLRNYWSKITHIPKSKCFNTKPDKRSKGKPTLKENYKGICRVIYYDTSLQFELQSIGEMIIKKWSWRGSNPRPFACHANARPS